jgi:hypothetical protein
MIDMGDPVQQLGIAVMLIGVFMLAIGGLTWTFGLLPWCTFNRRSQTCHNFVAAP